VLGAGGEKQKSNDDGEPGTAQGPLSEEDIEAQPSSSARRGR